MKKLSLTLIGLYLLVLHAFSQFKYQKDSVYETKPLKLEEINLVSSYYQQEGKHSAVQGGIGNEHVVDLANGIELKFTGWDMRHRKHSLSLEAGFDHHTAASSAYVNKTGASSTQGTRIYPSINWTVENDKGNSWGLGGYYSTEYNYKSLGLDVHGTHKIGSNTEINGKVSAFFDQVKMIYPSELVPGTTVSTSGTTTVYTTASGRRVSLSSGGGEKGENIPSSARNTFTASLSVAQVINKNLQASISTDLVSQNGYLGLPFHRVYFADGTAHVENLPSTRMKLPLGVRLNYFMGDHVVFRTWYRFYTDDWGITSNTAELEIPVKLNSFFSISPFYRYYTQTAAKYFAPYAKHTTADTYYTSNYALSGMNTSFEGLGMHLAPPGGVLNQHISSMDIRYGHYTQTTELNANIVSLALTFK
jgi:hypothetical protein